MNCPNCGRPVPSNEWAAYRRHEDCAVFVKARRRANAINDLSAEVRRRLDERRRKPLP